MKINISGNYELRYIDGLNWEVTDCNDFKITIDNKTEIFINEGFKTDFASIPRLFWNIYPPCGNGANESYGTAAIIHDWIYRGGIIKNPPDKITRYWADNVFLKIMEYNKVTKHCRYIMYWAVRCFGFGSWKR